ncbi:MAG: type VII secretion protein EccB [Pseudonocardiales bacterium]
MATTRDQAEAYGYESRRHVTGLVRGSDEAIADPRRRLNRTTLGSLVIAVLVMAGFGVAGFLGAGGGSDLPQSGAVVVAETGDQYVVIDGRVHPAINLASALLVGGGTPTPVSAEALGMAPRGYPIGIPFAPDTLPDSEQLSNEPWTVCTVATSGTSTVSMLVGLPAPAEKLGESEGVLVDEPDGATWLITQGRRYRVSPSVQILLGLNRATAVEVLPEVLDTVPEGPEIQVPAVPGSGAEPVPLPFPAVVGDVVRAQATGTPTRHFMVQRDGLVEISELTSSLLAASATRTVDLATAVNAAPSAQGPPENPRWPRRVPTLVDIQREQPLCVTTTPGQPPGDAAWTAVVSRPAAVPQHAGVTAVHTESGDVPGVLSEIFIAPGTAVLVRASSSSGQDGVYTLVTSSGQRFPMSSADAVSRLGYVPATVKPIPLPFVTLLPSGPVLDPEAAGREVPG